MRFRTLVVTLGSTLLLLALVFGLATVGGTPAAVQAAQNTPTQTVQPANTPVGTATVGATASPAATGTVRATATPRATATSTRAVTQTAIQTPTLETGPVITLTPTGALNITRTITVIGTGNVEASPDQAQVTIGVETSNTSVRNAVDENNRQMEAVIDALQNQGIPARNIQTSGFNIFSETPPPGPEPQATQEVTPTTRYHVTQQVNVVITDLDTVSDVLDAAIDAGANNIFGVNFTIGNPESLRAQAQRRAMQDALRSAENLAQLANVTLGGVVSISEVISGPGGPSPLRAAAEGLGGGGPPIQSGQLTFTQQLQVTFSIR